MITGYNTDVRHGDVVLHVQTEDKGEMNPCVESLVYVGGQVLARKRAGYRALLEEGGGSQDVVKLMETQHRSMIDEIRRGRLDEQLIAMGKRPGPTPTPPPAADPAPPPAAADAAPSVDVLPAPPPVGAEEEQTLDQVILDYLSAEARQEFLELIVEPVDPLRLGKPAVLRVRARSQPGDAPVAGAVVSLRLISTTDEPVELGEGETDERGELELHVSIPERPSGTAALIVAATSAIGDAEVKRLI